ncbi:LacI family DNA-binding transcriptional regulator [Rhodococcus koreensis]
MSNTEMGAQAGKPQQRPTIRDVASRAGVSKSLVSLVIRGQGYVSDEKRAAVEKAIGELGYETNAAARSLRDKRSRAVGVLLNDMRNPWFVELLDGLQSTLHTAGMHALLGDGHMNDETDQALVRMFREMNVDAIVLVGEMPRTASVAAAAADIPLVAAGLREIDLEHVDVVANDDSEGGTIATKHLLDLGHRRIGHIGGWSKVSTLRAEAYAKAMTDAGLSDYIDVVPSDLTEDGGYRSAVSLLNRADRPTALFCSNDMTCIGAYSAALSMGLRVPQDVALVGYDNTYLAQTRHLSLTSVNGANGEIGRRAGRAVLARIAGSDEPGKLDLVPPRLEIRNSSGGGIHEPRRKSPRIT